MINGALLIDKPEGMTSFGVVYQIKRALSDRYQIPVRKLPKVGHGGTLDPFATGLLVIFLGRGAKLAQYFLHGSKSYDATIRFGSTTASGDLSDPISETCNVLPINLEALMRAAEARVQSETYWQTPPMHSAQKINGKRLYQLAHQGVSVERAPKARKLFSINLSASNPNDPIQECKMDVTCSSGTYIRVLAQDLAKDVGSLGYLTQLRRTRSGVRSIEKALTLEECVQALKQGADVPTLSNFIPFDALLLEGFPTLQISQQEALSLQHGRPNAAVPVLARVSNLSPSAYDQCIGIYHQKTLIGSLVREQPDLPWRLDRVFHRPEKQTLDTSAPS